MTTYLENLKEAMSMLERDGYYFIGQSVKFSGTGLNHTLRHIPDDQKIELPVFEDVQAGIATGMSLEGLKVCSIYPRMDFLVLAFNQIVNHLDKAEKMSDGQFKPKVIIRTAIGSVKPLFPGEQHTQDHTEALKLMCKNINIFKLEKAEDIIPCYKAAMLAENSSILIEIPDKYNQEVFEGKHERNLHKKG